VTNRKGVSSLAGKALAGLVFTILFFGAALRFGGSIGSIISGIFGLLGIVKDTAIPFTNVSVLYVVELLIGLLAYIGGAYAIDRGPGFPGNFWQSMKRTALLIGLAAVVLAISGTVEGFGLRFSSYVGGEGLLFVGTVGLIKGFFRFLVGSDRI
jgi:hypothetical protein